MTTPIPQPTVAPTVEQVMAHTPGPLVLGRLGIIKGGAVHHFTNGSDQSQLFMAMAGIDMPHQERDANAARMVMCWNEHDALVKSSAELRRQVEALAVDAERLAQLERVVAGFPQDAIDGGWTAVGMSTSARRLEIELATARVDAERLDWIARQGDEFSFTILIDQLGDGNYVVFGSGREGEGKTFREAVDAARTPVSTQGEFPDSEGGV